MPEMILGNRSGGVAYFSADVDTIVGIAGTAVSDFYFKVYPNPASEMITILTDRMMSNADVSIFDLLGAERFHGEIDGRLLRVDASSFSSGVYLVKVLSGSTYTSRTFVVQ
jgi:hypothetical protein